MVEMKKLVTATHLKENPNYIHSSFSPSRWNKSPTPPQKDGVCLHDPFPLLCLVLPIQSWFALEWTGRSTWSAGLRWVISLLHDFATLREDKMFIQTITHGFKSYPMTFIFFWKGLDVFTMSDTAEEQIKVIFLAFSNIYQWSFR